MATRQVEQLVLELEDLECAQAAQLEGLQRKLEPAKTAAGKPVRRSLPDHLPREVERIRPLSKAARDAVRSCTSWENI